MSIIKKTLELPVHERFPNLFGEYIALAATIKKVGINYELIDKAKEIGTAICVLIEITPKEFITSNDLMCFSKFTDIAQDIVIFRKYILMIQDKINKKFSK